MLPAGCATAGRVRHFEPADAERSARALDAWRRAVARADSLPPSRILYDARVRQGIASLSGTLAVSTAEPIHAAITGPFGSAVAVYEDGALRGEKFAPVEIESEPLLWLLAGVWKAAAPEVRGIQGNDALLVWTSPRRVDGVLDVAAGRFTSLRVEHGRAIYEATYGGAIDPWPGKVDIAEAATSHRLVLTLVAHEPLP